MISLDFSTTPEAIRGILRQIKASGNRWIVFFLPQVIARSVLIEMDGLGMNSGFGVIQMGMTPSEL